MESKYKKERNIKPVKRLTTRLVLWGCLVLCSIVCKASALPTSDTIITGARLNFVENKGQWPTKVHFRTQMNNATCYLEDSCFTIITRSPIEAPATIAAADRAILANSHAARHFQGYNHHAYRMRFVGANRSATIMGKGLSEGYENYYLGNDSNLWASECRLFGCVEYRDLYPGINLKAYSTEHGLKYEYIVMPGANPELILVEYDSISSLATKDGNLIVSTSAGNVEELKPYVYQETHEGRISIEANYITYGNRVHIAIGSYDRGKVLVIDPYLHFSTYTGSAADNWGTTAAYDSYKNVYTAGLVFGQGYPVSAGAYGQSYHQNADIGIFKFDSTGSQRLFATYLGGNQADMPHSMYVNSLDELVIFGTTGSANFPTHASAYDRSFNGGTEIAYLCFQNNAYYRNIYYPYGSDIFVSRFNSTGTQLQASTYIGGYENDGLNYRTRYNNTTHTMMHGNDSLYYNYGDGARGEIVTDDLNNVYIGTTTMSNNIFSTSGSIQARNGGKQDGLVIKMDYNLSHMLWGTYIGGENDDAIYSIDVDSDYNLLICGGTNSRDSFPTTTGSYRTAPYGGSADGFVAKIAYNGDRLLASTYYGSPAYDQAYFVRCGRHNEVYIFGQTKASGSTLIRNAYYNVPNSGQFIARLKPDLDTVIWSTTFGTGSGAPNISPTAFGADICNRVYAVGWGRNFVGYDNVDWNTQGTTGMETTADAIQSSTDGQDFYIMSLSSDASQLEYATFFGELHQQESDGGGDHVDGGTSRFDKLGTLYQSVCASCGGHDGFPVTTGVWSEHNGNSTNCNNALFRFNINDDFAVAEFVQPPVGCAPYNVQFHNTGRGNSYTWTFGDGTFSTDTNPTHLYSQPGQYTVRLISTITGACTESDTCERTVLVLGNGQYTLLPTLSCDGTPQQIGMQPLVGCTYRWIQGNVSDSTIANPWVTENGDYILSVSANEVCSELDTFHIEFINLIDSIIVIPPSCPDACDGKVIAITDVAHSSGSLIYNWDGNMLPDSILFDQCGTNEVHTLVVSDSICRASATYSITGPNPMQIHKEASEVLCADTCNGWIHWTTDQGTDTLWSNLCSGTYTMELFDTIGCPYHDTTTITVSHTLDNVQAWATDTLIFLTESTQLNATPIDGATYAWQPAGSLNNPTIHNPVATPTDTLTTYVVTVTSPDGCVTSDSLTIRCIEVNCGEGNIFIPNAFTPNGDGANDRLCFEGDFITAFHIVIYSRWGELLYESSDVTECWDGRYKDNWCMPGVYTYSCKITCETGITSTFKGNVTIIR